MNSGRRVTHRKQLATYLIAGLVTITLGCQPEVNGPTGPEQSSTLNELASTDSQAVTFDPQSASLLSAGNVWTTRRSGPPPGRIELVAGTINGVIYVVGGDASADYPPRLVKNVDAYNVASNTWSHRQELPGARSRMNGASVINGNLYVTGGVRRVPGGGFIFTRVTFAYNPRTNRWSRKADMPVGGSDGVQGVIRGQLYVYLPNFNDAGALLRYTPATDRWVTLAPPPAGHAAGMGGVINGRFYLAGGCCEPNLSATRTLSAYNPNTNSWTTKASMTVNRRDGASGVINGRLYVAGGTDHVGNEIASVEAYDPATNRWTSRASMPKSRAHTAGAVANGKLYVIGGLGEDAMRTEAYTP
jgi:N-acetylneuraminic acid mutarotase